MGKRQRRTQSTPQRARKRTPPHPRALASTLPNYRRKERLAAVTAMAAALPGLKENLPGSAESVVRQLGNKPGWDEKNFQVLGKCFEVVLLLARADVGVGKREAALCVGGAADKLADTKLKCEASP